MKEFRVVIIVSHDQSDLYFANQLMRRLNVVGVIVENQVHERDETPAIIKAAKLIYKPHVLLSKCYDAATDRLRHKYAVYNQPENAADFGDQGQRIMATDNCEILYTKGVNNINAPEYIDWLKSMRPDVIAVCGASIFKDKLLAVPRHGVLNLHGGLSQKYRGLFTTDWAVHNEEPEYVGATVHYISPGIDDGDVVYQGRPENINANDNPNSLYVKVVKLGVNMMERAIKDIENGTVHSVPLKDKGKLYLGSMFTPKAKAATWNKLHKGIMADYLENKQDRDQKVLDIMINNFSDIYSQ